MRDTKLFKLLETFSKKERSDFRKFLQSPFHNGDADLRKLYLVLQPVLKDPQRTPMSEEAVFAAVFQGQPFNETLMRNQKHALLKQARAFLAHQMLVEDEEQQSIYLAQDARLRAQGKGFQKEWERQEKESSATSPAMQDPQQLYRRFLLGMQQVQARAQGGRRSADSFLLEAITRLDDYYLLQKLQLACALLNQRGIVETAQPLPGPDIEAFWDMGPAGPPAVKDMYHLVYQMLSQPGDEVHHKELLQLLLAPSYEWPPMIFEELLTYVLNWSIRRINQGVPQAAHDFLDLYVLAKGNAQAVKLMLKSHWQRKNLVLVAAREGKFALATEVNDADDVSADEPSFARAFNKAVIHFFEGNLELAEQGFLKVLNDAKDRFFQFDSLVFLMLMYHFLRQAPSRDSMYHRYRVNVNRNKEISTVHKAKIASFQKFFTQLMKISVTDRKGLQAFKSLAASNPAFLQHLWAIDWLERMRALKP